MSKGPDGGPWGKTPDLPNLTSKEQTQFEAAETRMPIQFFRRRFEEDAARHYPEASYSPPEVNFEKGYISYGGTEEDIDELEPAAKHAVNEANMNLERMKNQLRVEVNRAPINARNKTHALVISVLAAPKDA